MKKKEVAEWLIRNNGDCTGAHHISCRDCPLDCGTKFMNECHSNIDCGNVPGLSFDESSVFLAKEYLEWKAKKKEKKAAKEITDPRIGTIWEWTGNDGGVWKKGDRDKLISIAPNGEGVFEGRIMTWGLEGTTLIQVNDTKKEEEKVEFVPGRAYIGNGGTIVLCTNSEGKNPTNFSAIPIGGFMPEHYNDHNCWTTWMKDAFKPCKIEVKVIE